MSYRVGVQFTTFRIFLLARRLFTDRLTPPPAPRVYISISDKDSVRPLAPTSRLDCHGQISKGDLIGNAVQHRACWSAFKCQRVVFNQIVEVDVALPNATHSEVRRGPMGSRGGTSERPKTGGHFWCSQGDNRTGSENGGMGRYRAES